MMYVRCPLVKLALRHYYNVSLLVSSAIISIESYQFLVAFDILVCKKYRNRWHDSGISHKLNLVAYFP